MDEDRARASSFAGFGCFSEAFSAIADQSETLMAGMAEWIRVTTHEAPTDRVYYMLTAAGLHVGQEVTEKGRFSRKKTKRDYFVPTSSISALDWDAAGVVQVDTADGVRVILRFAEGSGSSRGPTTASRMNP